MDEVTAEYSWTRSDYFRAVRRCARGTRSDALFLLFTLVIAITLHIILFVLCIDTLLWALVSYVIRPIVAWNRTAGIKEPRRVKFSDAGIVTSITASTSTVEWSRFPRSRELSEYYLLIRNKYPVATPIKKAFFSTSLDESKFRMLLKRHTKASLRTNPGLDALTSEVGD